MILYLAEAHCIKQLKEVYVLHESQAVLAGNENVIQNNKELLDKFIFRVNAVLKAKESKYIL